MSHISPEGLNTRGTTMREIESDSIRDYLKYILDTENKMLDTVRNQAAP